ncbi:hypothetical protein J3R82DRAFT_7818 [Butyriboletus roseoflavus]|nr:hypothetical protein J3R82DRAFT_7818 [Butyriboletus roseoflavus]
MSGYYNQVRILDPVMFDTDVVLPNMPGAVNNILAGRNYPMQGTSMLLPQYAPYTDQIENLICGGSTPGAGIALDNCITIAPEVESDMDAGTNSIEESNAVHGHASGRVSQPALTPKTRVVREEY